MVNYKIVGGVIAVVTVVAVIVVWSLAQAPKTGVSTKDPADIILKLNDLPTGYSALGETSLTPDNWTLNVPYSTMQGFGYQTGLGRAYQSTGDNKSILSVALRFSSTDGAENAYDVLVAMVENFGDIVPHSTIGDQSYINVRSVMMGSSNINRHSGTFRKQNFVGMLESYNFTNSEVINYLQIIANRI